MASLSFGAAVLSIAPLIMILAFLVYQGASSVNLDFFTHLPKPVGEPGGGMANAIVGSIIMIGLASCLAIPVGILGGLYLAGGRDPRLPWLVRFTADVLNGVPSIVFGIFAYTVLVLPMRRFSAIAGGFAVALIMVPVVLRTTAEMVRLVPRTLRQPGAGRGVAQWNGAL